MRLFGIAMIVSVLCLAFSSVLPVEYSNADVCHTQVRRFSGSAYVAPVVNHVNYAYPQVYAVPIQQDYYFSAQDYYKEKLLLDTIKTEIQKVNESNKEQYIKTLELLLKLKTGQVEIVPGGTPVNPGQVIPEQIKGTNVDPKFLDVVVTNCLECHNSKIKKGNLSLENLDVLSETMKWKMHSLVCAEVMPPKAKMDIETKKLFFRFAEQ